MCFSPEASFGVGVVLLPAGAYCVRRAWAADRKLLAIAVVPLGFGAQQIAEGFVWLGLDTGDADRVRAPSLVFLFFALAGWPFWVPLSAAVSEPRRPLRRALFAWAAAASAWFWVLYAPLVTDPGLLTVGVSHHSIRYAYPDLTVYRYVPRPALRGLYLLTLTVPFLVARPRCGALPGLVLAGSAAAAVILFDYAFVSVWCFFAAAGSAVLCHSFRRLSPEPPRQGSA